MIRLVQYQPEIPQNTGTLLRTVACFGLGLDIIEPIGFALSDAKLKRAGMDYLDLAAYERHVSWEIFKNQALAQGRRLVYLTPHAPVSYYDFAFTRQDSLILGRESCGIPEEIADQIPYHISIAMVEGRRSLNVALAGAMVLGEAMRQLKIV
jgi:tRNA (cytidine/uridine-2'-O-)-methyltransferase